MECRQWRQAEAGAQPRSWRQFQRLSLLSAGCGGITDHG